MNGGSDGIDIGRTTLHRILVNAGLSSPLRRRPPKNRVRRQCMLREGMLVQMDGSHRPWLGGHVPPFTLLIAVDDATGAPPVPDPAAERLWRDYSGAFSFQWTGGEFRRTADGIAGLHSPRPE